MLRSLKIMKYSRDFKNYFKDRIANPVLQYNISLDTRPGAVDIA